MNRYREARIRAGLSQKAAAISLGVRPPSMSDWECGKSNPTHEHLVAMAALYSTTTDYLTGVTDDPEIKKQLAAQDGELLSNVISRIQALPDSVLSRVADFLEGVQAGQAASEGLPDAPGPAGGPSQ